MTFISKLICFIFLFFTDYKGHLFRFNSAMCVQKKSITESRTKTIRFVSSPCLFSGTGTPFTRCWFWGRLADGGARLGTSWLPPSWLLPSWPPLGIRKAACSFWKASSCLEKELLHSPAAQGTRRANDEPDRRGQGGSSRAKELSLALTSVISYICFSVARAATSCPVYWVLLLIPAMSLRE